jgi:hypothetical protein
VLAAVAQQLTSRSAHMYSVIMRCRFFHYQGVGRNRMGRTGRGGGSGQLRKVDNRVIGAHASNTHDMKHAVLLCVVHGVQLCRARRMSSHLLPRCVSSSLLADP